MSVSPSVHPLSGLVVLCRPGQMREAAIVLSCCPRDTFTPLIVVEPSPLSEAEYRARYARYVAARDERDAISGTALSREQAAGTVLTTANSAVDAAAAELTHYRSWWRHQRLVAELLSQHPPTEAILLFDPEPGDLDQLDAIPMARIGDTRLKLLPVETKVTRLGAAPLAGLPLTAWQRLGGGAPIPDGIGVADDTAAAWFAALAHSLRTGRPIRPDAPPDLSPLGQAGASEAVLIEISDSAERLIGVQYAQTVHASLILTPEPELEPIRKAIAAMQDVADSKLFEALKEYLFGDPALSDALEQIEAAVNAVVPDAVVSAVGALDLTVFTTGVPYGFVRRGDADWSKKPIGHVSGDASLLILTEMLGAPDDGDVGFSLIFDPGFFKTAETADVLASLGDRVTHPIVLDGLAASNLALLRLGGLPLDVVYFNTHGSNREILLAEGPLPAHKLQQRQRLRSRPFVFNSSCLSWIGVGREFVRVGARGYAGTLWSVNAQHASDYARIVVDRVTRQGMPFARAMRTTKADRKTELAYIFVGTVSARLGAVPGGQSPSLAAPSQRRFARGAQILLNQLTDSQNAASSGPARVFDEALQTILWREAEALMAAHAQDYPGPNADWVQIAALKLKAISQWGNGAPGRIEAARQTIPLLAAERARLWPNRAAEYIEAGKAQLRNALLWIEQCGEYLAGAPALYEEARQMLDGLTLDRAARDAACAELTLQAGRVFLALNNFPRAVELLAESAKLAASGDAAPALLSLCDALRRDGRPAEALKAATDALEAAKSSAQPDRTRMLALGRQTQLMLASGNAEGAAAGARDGFALATILDDPGELTAFKGDEARALLRLKRFEDAAAAAAQYRSLARQSRNDEADLAGCGVLAAALIGCNRLDEAARLIDEGLAFSRQLGFARSQGDFLLDRHGLRARGGDHRGAMQAALEAAAAYIHVRDMAQTGNAFARAMQSFERLRLTSSSDEWIDALFAKAEAELEAFGLVNAVLQNAMVAEALSRFPDLCARGPNETVAARLAKLGSRAEVMLAETAPNAPPLLVLMVRLYRTFERLARADKAGARKIAQEADAIMGGKRMLQLVEKLG